MNRHERRGLMVFYVLLVVTIALAGFGNAVLHLWNWLMPDLFGLRAITYWQAVGLMSLCWILFGGLRTLGGPLHHRSHGRWQPLTEEERQRLRQPQQTGG